MACEVIVAHQISAQITDSKATASKLKKMMLMFMLGGPCAFIVLAMAFGLGGFWFGFIAWILGLFFLCKACHGENGKG
ncbi:hypothetical protein ABHF33_07150 [Chitinibacter sp. FCG-7]|uniref:Uncharacterized protein n=1 Tax=Chitinibacter mangrovi TaxID=3153927 RepID=A0AAU7FEG9_9NEIS